MNLPDRVSPITTISDNGASKTMLATTSTNPSTFSAIRKAVAPSVIA